MGYTSFINERTDIIFGKEPYKLAADLAALLDSPVLAPGAIKAQRYGTRSLALMRVGILDDFSTACVQCGLPAVEPELETLELCLAGDVSPDELKRVKGLVRRARKSWGKKARTADPASDLAALIRCLELMPDLATGYGDNLGAFKAAVNIQLIKLNKPAIRRDPSKPVKNALDRPAPGGKPLTVVCVDDDAAEIVRTMRALAGWPGIEVMPFRFTADLAPGATQDKSRVWGLLRAAAKAVLELKPDIVLMDEGMPPIDGGQLIDVIRSFHPESRVEFVGNSGGAGDHLRLAGAIGNMRKGLDLEPLETAIRRFSHG